jgi:hypothetical protein
MSDRSSSAVSSILDRPRSRFGCARRLARSACCAIIALPLLAACTRSVEPISGPSAFLQPVSPTQLEGTVGRAVDPIPTVRLTDDAGAPVAGATLFVTQTADAVAWARSVVTDANGEANIAWTLWSMPGTQEMRVRVGRDEVVFTALAKPGPVTSILMKTGGGQIGAPGAPLPDAVSVLLRDALGNVVPGETVSFSVADGGAIGAATATSDSAGVARAGSWTLGPGEGLQQLRVRVGDAETVVNALASAIWDRVPGSWANPFELVLTRGDQIHRMRADGTGVLQVTASGVNGSPVWSPDGRRIAFLHSDDPTGHGADVWLMESDGSNKVRLTSSESYGGGPLCPTIAWSPDGTRLAVSTGGPYASELTVIDTAGVPYTSSVIQGRGSAWSPDGQRIAIVRPSGDDGYESIWTMNADGSDQRQLTPPGGWVCSVSWTPDGLGVAFTDNGTIHVVNLDGSGSRTIETTQKVQTIDWSPDGTWLAVSFGDDWPLSVGYVPFIGGSPSLLLANAWGAAWRPR